MGANFVPQQFNKQATRFSTRDHRPRRLAVEDDEERRWSSHRALLRESQEHHSPNESVWMQCLWLTLGAEGASPVATGGDTIGRGDVMAADGAGAWGGSGGSAVTVIDAKPTARLSWAVGRTEVPAQASSNKMVVSPASVTFLIRIVLPTKGPLSGWLSACPGFHLLGYVLVALSDLEKRFLSGRVLCLFSLPAECLGLLQPMFAL